MTIHYGNLIVDGIVGVGETISGGYILPTTIGMSGDSLMVIDDGMGNKSLQFRDSTLIPSNFKIITTNTVLDASSAYIVISGGASVVILPSAVTLDHKFYRLSNLSGLTVTISGSHLIDYNASYSLLNNGKVELKAEQSAWWTF